MSDKEDFCPSISQHCLAPAAAPSQQQAGGDQTEDGGQYGGAAQPEPAREPLAVRLSPHPSHQLADGGQPPHGRPAPLPKPPPADWSEVR